MAVRILLGDCRDILKTLPDGSVHCVVTSPPYFALRSYLADGDPAKPYEMGAEGNVEAYVAAMIDVFREVKRVLRDDGVVWLNLGDTYSPNSRNAGQGQTINGYRDTHRGIARKDNRARPPKNLLGIPWRVVMALQDDGWYWRSRLPWLKRCCMPESITDRPTSAVEDIFLLSKSETYFYDFEAVMHGLRPASVARLAHAHPGQKGSNRAHGGAKASPMRAVASAFGHLAEERRTDKQHGHGRRHSGFNDRWNASVFERPVRSARMRNSELFYASLEAPHGVIADSEGILALDVTPKPFKESHYATYAPDLIEPLIKAGCPVGGTVLDPFFGAGTTGLVADRLGRNCIGIELNPAYVEIARGRIQRDAGLFADLTVDTVWGGSF